MSGDMEGIQKAGKSGQKASNLQKSNNLDELSIGDGDDDYVLLQVLGQDNKILKYKIKREALLSNLIRAYCRSVGIAAEVARFRFNGYNIDETDTPNTMDMCDGDVIEVFCQQMGG